MDSHRDRNKIYGDLAHILIGYTGGEKAFDIFRKYIVGDISISRHSSEPYNFTNAIERSSLLVKKFNDLMDRIEYRFNIMVALHRGRNSQLYYIDVNGNSLEANYKSIGSGKAVGDEYCKITDFDEITMKAFARNAYFAINYMDKMRPELGVGLDPEGFPLVKYLDYDLEWDREAPEEDIEDFKIYSDNQLRASQK